MTDGAFGGGLQAVGGLQAGPTYAVPMAGGGGSVAVVAAVPDNSVIYNSSAYSTVQVSVPDTGSYSMSTKHVAKARPGGVPVQMAQPSYNQLAPAEQHVVLRAQPGAYRGLDADDMTWASTWARTQSSDASLAVRQVQSYDQLHVDDRTDDFTDVGELFGEATADDGVTNSSYIPADIALTATTASAAAAAALPAQPKRGLKKRAERKGSVYDGFGDNDAPAEDGTISGWLAAPAVSKDGAEAALDRVGAGVGSFCFRSGSTGLVLCVVTGDGQIGHFRLQQGAGGVVSSPDIPSSAGRQFLSIAALVEFHRETPLDGGFRLTQCIPHTR